MENLVLPPQGGIFEGQDSLLKTALNELCYNLRDFVAELQESDKTEKRG
jgi:hypothetical protein